MKDFTSHKMYVKILYFLIMLADVETVLSKKYMITEHNTISPSDEHPNQAYRATENMEKQSLGGMPTQRYTYKTIKTKFKDVNEEVQSNNSRSNQHAAVSGHTEWTIPSLLAYSNNNETHKENQWFKYIMELVRQSLRYCQMDTPQTTASCASIISTKRSLSRYVIKVIHSLMHTRPDLSLHNTCQIDVPFREPRLLFSSYLGMMEFIANCSSTWEVHMHQTCAINITITTKHWDILEVQCLSLHIRELQLCEGSHLTELQFLTCLECFCETELSIRQLKPNNSHIGSVCGHLPPQTFMIPGNAASIVLKQNKHIPNRIRFIVQHQCINIFEDSYESTTLFSGKITHNLAYERHAIKAINHNEILPHVSINRRLYDMVTVTVDLMLHVYLIMNLSPPRTSCTPGGEVDSSIIIVDGPMSATDAVNYFPVVTIMDGTGSCQFVHRQTWISTLNDATVISSHGQIINSKIINLKYEAKLIPCQPNICNFEIKHVFPDLPIIQSVYSAGTHIYNYTYVMETPVQDYLAINVTSLSFDGFYSMSCRYGSATFYYAGTGHEQEKMPQYLFNIYAKYKTYASPQMVIGSYCSPSTIDGLLEAAEPLYLGKGTLSVVVKTYQHVTKVSINYTIITSKHHGVLDSYLVNKYGDYIYKEHLLSNNSMMSLLVDEQSIFYAVWISEHRFDGTDMYIEINISPGNRVHYQWITSDYDLTLMSRIWLAWHRTAPTQEVILNSPHTVTRLTPTVLNVNIIIPDEVIYIWRHISRISNLHPMVAQITSDSAVIGLQIHEDSAYDHVDSLILHYHKHLHALGVSTHFTMLESSTVEYIVPLIHDISYFFHYLVDGITLLNNSKPVSLDRDSPGNIVLLDVNYLPMLKTNQFWQFIIDQRFRNVIFDFISPKHCLSVLKVAYMYTRYAMNVPIMPYRYAIYVNAFRDLCAVSEYRNFTVGRLVSLGTRHKWRGLTLASDDYTHWKHGCKIDVMFHYEKYEPFSGFPPYQAAALVDIKAPNQWRMCRLGRCYMLRDDSQFPKVSTWDEAERFCQSHNGHLLSINSDTEQSVVLDWLLRRPFTRHFKGIKRQVVVATMPMYLRASIIFIGLKANSQVSRLIVFTVS